MRRWIVVMPALMLAMVAAANDGLIPFGELLEDTLIQTGAVVVAETDHIAIPMIDAISNKVEAITLHDLAVQDDRVPSLQIAEPLITNLLKGAFSYVDIPAWPASGTLLPGEYGSGGNLWADLTTYASEKYLWNDRTLDEYLWNSFYDEEAPFLPVFPAGEWVLAIVDRVEGYLFRMMYLGADALPVDDDHGASITWVPAADPEYSPAATEEWVRNQISDYEEQDPVAMAAIAQIPGADGIFTDVATDQVYHIVVSNGHWLIRYAE